MATYDEKVLLAFAEQLYQQAFGLIFTSAIRYGLTMLVGAFIGIRLLVTYMYVKADSDALTVMLVGLVVIATLFGIRRGQQLGFQLKLQAQTLLVQVEIERNTRKPNL